MFNHYGCREQGRRYQDRPNQRSVGFTLVELLVVISIIGILIGLMLPAVMSAIESGRRTQCANNLHQIGLAVNTYETSQRQYPLNWGYGTGTTVGSPTTNATIGVVGVSWLTYLLPNIDEKSLYDATSLAQAGLGKGIANFYAANYQNAANGIDNLSVLKSPIKTFLCPSDSQRGHIGNQMLDSSNSMLYATTNYKACAGMNWTVSYNNGTQGPAVTSLRGRNNNNADGVDHGNGVICRGGGTSPVGTAGVLTPTITTNADLRDGATKTFLAGECVPEWSGWSLWFWFDGSTATCGTPLNLRIPGVPPQSNANNWKAANGFMSRHKGGANFAMCDGSVSYINEAIDMATYQALATIDGGEPVEVPGG
jgi:prepilin-type processing-associated H-X9-DG protein/prepilin-type N-terminal cleavage/methylation domain-containing protein